MAKQKVPGAVISQDFFGRWFVRPPGWPMNREGLFVREPFSTEAKAIAATRAIIAARKEREKHGAGR